MDNITHSLIGAGIGESALKRPDLRAWYWLTGILASNVPDSDIWIPLILGERKYTGLLHHRGHTHTYLASLFLALAVYGFVVGLAKLRKRSFSAAEHKVLLLLSFAGTVLHIVADSWNSYGVHPYWPFDSHWYYGDFVFIVEPWIWLFLAPALAFSVRHRLMKVLLGAVILFMLLLAWRVAYVHWLTKYVLTVAAAVLPIVFMRIKERARVFWALGLVCLLLTGLWTTKQFVRRTLTELSNGGAFYDTAMNPYPGDPFCWSAFLSSHEGNEFRIRMATIVPFPSLFDTSWCPPPRFSKTTAPLRDVSAENTASVQWWGEYRGDLRELRALAAKSCKVAAVLRFMRMPYWKKLSEKQWIVGDLRFDRDESIGFTEFEIDLNEENKCPPAVPGWVEPLAPLLANGAEAGSASSNR